MNGLGKPFRKNATQNIEKKTVKIEVKLPHVNKDHSQESEFLFKQGFLTILFRAKKNSRRKITSFFAPLPVSA